MGWLYNTLRRTLKNTRKNTLLDGADGTPKAVSSKTLVFDEEFEQVVQGYIKLALKGNIENIYF